LRVRGLRRESLAHSYREIAEVCMSYGNARRVMTPALIFEPESVHDGARTYSGLTTLVP